MQLKEEYGMSNLRYAVFGTGFWSQFQIAAWNEVGGVELAAVYNRTRPKAEAIAERFGVPHVYSDPEELFQTEKLDFVDIITEIDAHAPLVKMAAKYHIPVICQKPMAPSLEVAEEMVAVCQAAGVPFFIHENFRWQAPMRAFKEALNSGAIGRVFRARIDMITGFPVFKNQPALATLEHFIITDLGSHTLDLARFFFGEASSLYCQTSQVHREIKGEDVATIMLQTEERATVTIHMAYAENYLERECFPQTRVFVEGEFGSIELDCGNSLRVTTHEGTHARTIPVPFYAWADPNYDIVHASIVPCNANILQDLCGEGKAETTAADNLKTVRLVFASYASAAQAQAIRF